MDETREIQENLFEYFDKVEDVLFVAFVDSFVYNNPAKYSEVSVLSEQFLKDNGLEEVFIKYNLDLSQPKSFFTRTSMSERSLIETIKFSLLSLSHNRFRQQFK